MYSNLKRALCRRRHVEHVATSPSCVLLHQASSCYSARENWVRLDFAKGIVGTWGDEGL
jgi:hypothetical protein